MPSRSSYVSVGSPSMKYSFTDDFPREKAMEQDADGVFKVNGQKVMIPFIYKSTDNMMISMLKQKDAP